MKKPLLIIALLLGLALPGHAKNSLLESHLSRAYDYLNQGQFDDAIIEFQEALSIDRESPEAIEGIETVRSLRKKQATKALPIEPTPQEVEEKIEPPKIGEAKKMEAPKVEEAELGYPNALILLILLPLLLLSFTLILVYRKKHNRILKRYNGLLTYERTCGYLPEDRDLVKMLANLYKEEEIFDSTSALAYERAEMFAEAALSYHNSKDLTKAAEMYEKKCSLEGDDNAILQRLAQIYHDLGQEDRMVSILRRMVRVRENPYDLSVLGELCEKLKDTEGAISAYEKLSQLDKKTPEYQDRLLKLYFENGHKERFLTLAEEMWTRGELTLENFPRLASIYIDNLLFDKASEVYRKLTEEKPEHRYEFVETLLIQNRIDEALEECQKLPLTNSQEVNNLLDLYGKISEKHPDNGQVKNLIEETYRKAEENGLEINLSTKNNEREQIFRPPLIKAQDPYTILTEKNSPNSHSEQ